MNRNVAFHPSLFAVFFSRLRARTWVLHPLFLVAVPVLNLCRINIHEMVVSDMLLPMLFVLAVTCVALVLGILLFRNAGKVGLILSVAVVLMFAFRDAQRLLARTGGLSNMRSNLMVLLAWLLVFLVSLYFVVRTRRELRKLTRILNWTSLILVGIAVTGIVAARSSSGGSRVDIQSMLRDDQADPLGSRPAEASGDLPDIYYLVFDRYAGERSLREFYNFDNTEFLEFLKRKGFFVASRSNANYLKTAHSLASSLNMRYIPSSWKEETADNNWLPFFEVLKDHRLARILKARGYTYIHSGSWFAPTSGNKEADAEVSYSRLSEFSWALYKSTALYPVAGWLFGLSQASEQYDRVLYKFRELARIPKRKGPVFVFAHFLIPHPPYIFHKDGRRVSRLESVGRDRRTGYVDQLTFTNRKIMDLVETLQAESARPPVIIIQSDEGPFPERYRKNAGTFKWLAATDAELRLKMGILNAYYLPGVDTSGLSPSITPVNSFRLVFDLYFGGDYEMLPDRSYVFPDDAHLYEYHDVTDRLR